MIKQITALALAGLMLCTALVGCGEKKPDFVFACINASQEEEDSEMAAFGKTQEKSNMTVENADSFTINDSHIVSFRYRSANEAILAFETGKVNGVYLPMCVAQYLVGDDPEVKIVTDTWRTLYHMAALPTNSDFIERVDQQIEAWLEDGTLAALERTYLEGSSSSKEPTPVSLPRFEGQPTVKVAITGSLPPFDYISAEGTPAGFSVAMLAELGKALEVNFELFVVDTDAKMLALVSGKVDMLLWIDAANEPLQSSQSLALTRPYYTVPNVYATTENYYEIVKVIAAVE